MVLYRSLFLCSLIFVSLGCGKSHKTTRNPPEQNDIPKLGGKIEASSLLTKDEVGAVQGSLITEAKSSETSDGAHVISLCYYAATELSKSVSLALTEIDPKQPNAPNPRTSWEQTFGRFKKEGSNEAEHRKDAKKGGEEDEEKTPPEKIEGVGDEAFWAGNRFGGALYVLKGDCSLRISVGGPGDQKSKLEKSKALAKKAISKLPK